MSITQSSINDLMVKIPEGTVQMRDDRTKKKWSVEIDAFFLSRFPVTQHQYFEINKENPCTFKGDDLPVETISWQDAISFCNQLSKLSGLAPCYSIDLQTNEISCNQLTDGYRLPTEAEWQYACLSGDNKIRYGLTHDIAWFKENADRKTHIVGTKAPNHWGLYDMLGNVWEWCSDIYDQEVYGSYRVFRGGGWFDEERSIMATTRRRSHPTSFKIDDLGFRIARNLK